MSDPVFDFDDPFAPEPEPEPEPVLNHLVDLVTPTWPQVVERVPQMPTLAAMMVAEMLNMAERAESAAAVADRLTPDEGGEELRKHSDYLDAIRVQLRIRAGEIARTYARVPTERLREVDDSPF